MFTGIIEQLGRIVVLRPRTENGLTIAVETPYTDLIIGESIAVAGICLTVTTLEKTLAWFDLSNETLAKTNAAYFKQDQIVNLERALRMGDRMGGHYVSGHVDECLAIENIKQQGEYCFMSIRYPSKRRRWLVAKGSITINGVSLTVNELTEDRIELMLIPHTLAVTDLKNLSVGEYVNIEYDWMLKTVATQMDLLGSKQ